jgi:hypothetical protein
MARHNLLRHDVEYKTDETPLVNWRRYMYPTGQVFSEFVSHRRVFGLPLIHYTHGRCPETGRRIVACGVFSIGRLALGIVAIGHASAGFIAIGQLAIRLLFGLGQAASGIVCVGQLALGVAVGIGQFATGCVAIGQMAFGHYVLAQYGLGTYVWDMRQTAPAAEEFFRSLLPFLRKG